MKPERDVKTGVKREVKKKEVTAKNTIINKTK